MRSTPVTLAGGLMGGAIIALALTLTASVRRRRRDLAVLKTLGFTGRQLAAVVTWEASAIVIVGLLIGVPAGFAAGRQMWTLFARSISAVPRPTVTPSSLVAIIVGAGVLGNIVGIIPARRAARVPAAVVLHHE